MFHTGLNEDFYMVVNLNIQYIHTAMITPKPTIEPNFQSDWQALNIPK